MRLSDVMSHAGLSGYAIVALVLFLAAFTAIVIRVVRARRPDLDRLARMPLEDDSRSEEPERE